MGSALRQVAATTSSAGGAAAFTFQSPSIGEVWTGSVFVSMAPAGATSNVTIGSTSGGLPWGSMVGGQALLVQAVAGEVIQITSTGLAAATSYTAVLAGSVDNEQDASYTGPFPAAPVSAGSVLAKGTPIVLPSLASPINVVSSVSSWVYGAWATIGTLPATDTAGYGLTGIVLTGGSTGGASYQIQLSTGASAGALLLGEWGIGQETSETIVIVEPIVVSASAVIYARLACSAAASINMTLNFTGN